MTASISSQFDVTGFGVIVIGAASGLGLAYGEVLAAQAARVTFAGSQGSKAGRVKIR